MLHPQERGWGGTLIFSYIRSLDRFFRGLGGVKILNFSIFLGDILPLNWTIFRVILGIFKVRIFRGVAKIIFLCMLDIFWW